ncbi:MAG: DNA repair protein RecO [Candidatus Omnitrophota bacterium]
MIAKTEAIVLKSFDFRETSRIATFLTKDFGKVKGVLKGIRKTPGKFGSSLDRFTVNDIVYYQYRNSDIHLVSQCDMKEFYSGFRQDLKRLTAASYAAELLDTLVMTDQENLHLYELMQNFLKSLETVEDINKLVHIFQIKVLQFSGFRPHLDSCVRCQKKITGQTIFSMPLGGLVCVSCKAPAGSMVAVTKGTVASIMHIEESPWEVTLRLGLSDRMKKELKYVLNHFLVFHLERHLRSTRYL